MAILQTLCLSACLVMALHVKSGQGQWSYPDEGSWKEDYPDCDGRRQSPIIINEAAAIFGGGLRPFNFVGYDTAAITYKIENDGHTVKVSPTGSVSIEISGGGLRATYKFAQYHFHWGNRGNRDGSEHRFGTDRECFRDPTKCFPGELHLVHYKDTFADLGAAVASGERDAVAVLGILLTVGLSDNPKVQPIIDEFECITTAGTAKIVSTLPALQDLLPPNPEKYFRYLGSLTTPGCAQVVRWTVFAEPLSVGHHQIGAFRHLLGTDGNELRLTYRDPQPINTRTVRKSFR